MHLCIHAFMFMPHVCVHVGGGGRHPGSTLSQAASRQAGLSHGPPGEGCLLWARAVMIVPAGGIAHAHSLTHMRTHTHTNTHRHTQICICPCMKKNMRGDKPTYLENTVTVTHMKVPR